MRWGTACGKLRKALLFSLVQRLGLDLCLKCGLVVETAEELSIDHVVDWLDVDPALFWDVDNIKFSHRLCNRPGRVRGGHTRKVGPEGTAWCYTHREFLPVVEFSRCASRWNGRQYQCRECAARQWAATHAARVKVERHCKACFSLDGPFVGARWLCVGCYRIKQRDLMRVRRQTIKQ